MNKENLRRAAEYLRTVPQEKFNMRHYRGGVHDNGAECRTVGCAMGHLTVLWPEKIRYSAVDGQILFGTFSRDVFGIKRDSHEWSWIFSSVWEHVDNTPEGAALRIEWLLDNGIPDNIGGQMYRNAPLCYRNPVQP